ncbi:MAG: hypothetical protein LC700_04290 [Actinobacteria bacterium]|nr:hypothetical protein [Actinomycetota bacterium]
MCNISVKISVTRRILLNLRPGGGVILRDDRSAKAAQVPFAAGVTNVPAGQIANVKLGLRKAGKLITRASTRKRIRGVMEIRTSTGAFRSISSIPVRLKLP